jgi:hypothetical protein
MKNLLTKLFALVLTLASATLSAQAPVPDLLYYRFNGTGTTVPNEASAPPAGTATATIMGGLTQGPAGQCGNALIGNGQTSGTNYVNTNWATNLNGTSWTLSFWTNNVPSTTSTFYILGDVNAGGFRVFTGGVAGAGNWILRGGFTDILATGGAATGPALTTFVYDMAAGEMRAYVNGTLVSTVAQPSVLVSGTGPFKVGGYSTSSSLPNSSLMDEFRLYSRALTVSEIQSLMISNTTSTISPASCTTPYIAPSGASFSTAGTYQDIIPNVNGCDSVITINLSFVPAATSTLSAISCGSYTAPSGAVLTASGTYNDTISAVNGCDSVIMISLTINNATTASISPSACDMYTAPSGAMYMSSGTFMDTIANSLGCDSIITISLTIIPTTYNSVTASGCSSYTAPSGTVFTASGIYNDTIMNAMGCDSVITINLTVNMPTSSSMGATACHSFTAPSGTVYTASGVYSDTVMNAAGCDSVITIMLTINENHVMISPMACDSFISPGGAVYYNSGTYMDTLTNMMGCDSIFTINLVVGNSSSSFISATACNSYTAPSGAVYTVSSTYLDVIPNSTGCDSLITISLVVNNANVATTQNGATLTATAAGATYQWVTCPSMMPVFGATGQSYTASTNGSYAVIVTQNNCSDTSACLNVTGIGIAENGFGGLLNVYPNPSKGEFFIDLGATYNDISVVATDVTGRVMFSKAVSSGNLIPVELDAPAGVYMIRVTAENHSAVIRLVKE